MKISRMHLVMGVLALWFGAASVACGPTTIDQSSGGNGGSGGNTSSNSSSSGEGGGSVVACDPMNLPADGSPCAKEGESCSPGCEDPCSFCNVKICTNGVWSNVEAFPAPCLSCEDVCVPVVDAKCAGGPPDQAACVQGCEMNQMGNCKIAFNQMLACVGSTPTFTCDAMTRPTVVNCDMEFEKLYTCLGL
jgi:hypothetical protein